MKIYVDFDRTLFDCDRFLEDLYTLINKYSIPKTTFRDCQNQCKRKGFNPYTILDLVKKEYNFDESLYLEVRNLIRQANTYLYVDAIPFLEYLKNNNYDVIILTKGNKDYQKEKIFNAKIDSYYNKLIVTMKHKGCLNIEYNEGVFIDDNPLEILSIIKKQPKKIIRIERNNLKYNDVIDDDNIINVKSLKEIIDNKEL